jgi:tRNA pseudouridine13 synthase
MKVLNAEKKIGINIFYNHYNGIGGKLRTKPEDFKVDEISNYPPKNSDGNYTIADVNAVHWETNLLIRDISNRLHVSRQRIGFAGTKDKRASTTRVMSFYNIPIEKLSQVKIKNVNFSNIYKSNQPIRIGDLQGNKFDIIIRNLEKNIKKSHIDKIASFISSKNGFPNFFGIQRFGIIRPITHVVGRYIINGDFENAAMSYIANPCNDEDEEIYNMRKELQDTYDFQNHRL